MKVILFGATGMIGQGVLRECLLDPDVTEVLAIGRAKTGKEDPKLRELAHADFTDFGAVKEELRGYDACFFCLGVSSAGMNEADYTRVTYDYTLAAARAIAEVSPKTVFIYVSGAGTDATEKGRSMWARVKGKTENAIFALPLENAYMFRAGAVQPLHGITSKTPAYRVAYALAWPFMPALKALMPGMITTTERIGLAMLRVAKRGSDKRVLENSDINALAS